MPHRHAQHAQNVGPNLFARNENHAYVMPRVTTCAMKVGWPRNLLNLNEEFQEFVTLYMFLVDSQQQ